MEGRLVRLTQCDMYAITNIKIFFDQPFSLPKYCLKLSRKGHSAHYIISRHLYNSRGLCGTRPHGTDSLSLCDFAICEGAQNTCATVV